MSPQRPQKCERVGDRLAVSFTPGECRGRNRDPQQCKQSEGEGVGLMVPRLPELPPDTMMTVCGDRRCKRGTMVTGWLDKKQHEILIALHEDPQSVVPS